MKNLFTFNNLILFVLGIILSIAFTSLFNSWFEYDRAVAFGTLITFLLAAGRYAYFRYVTKTVNDVNGMVASILGIILSVLFLC